MKKLQQVEFKSATKLSTCLSSAVYVATLYDFVDTLKNAAW
jgi:hypothetical protein